MTNSKNNKDKKILFMDLDGTFLRNVNLDSFSQTDLNSLKKFQEEGNYLVINTGRSYIQAKEVRDVANLNVKESYLSSANGATIYKGDDIIQTNHLNKDEVEAITNYVSKKYKHVGFKLPETNCYYSNSKRIRNLVEWFTHLERKTIRRMNIKDEGYSKYGVILLTSKRKNYKIWEDLKDKFPQFNIFLTGHDFYLEIVKKGVSKGDAVKSISKILDVKIENTYAAGDSGNDHSMLKVAGNAIMMKNIPQYIIEDVKKDKSNKNYIVTKSVSKDGLTDAMKYFDLI
ncbi:MAG: HAD family phosphatase [Mycoplasmataceae bacterium]|nr:HAD family phosphatase [Mycoplasmataceae bacterium]